MQTRIDGFLGGKLAITQPLGGYRAGADAVMLAAACPAKAGQTVLELGCGAGVASLCLAARVSGLLQTGLERDAGYAALVRQNATANALALNVVEGDLATMPAELRAQVFDHVIANPPFFGAGSLSPDPARAVARHEETPLDQWLDAGLRRLAPGGWLTMIHLPARLDTILAALAGRAGAVSVLPVAARAGRDAGRVIVTARKGARAPLRLLAPFVMHMKPLHSADGEDLTPAAQAVLRDAAPILTMAKESG